MLRRRLPVASVLLVGCGPLPSEPELEPATCREPCHAVHEVQGAGTSSPLARQVITVCGVVTAALPAQGFYLQSERSDGDPLTSEGLFVGLEAGAGPAPRRRVTVRGQVREQDGVTELRNVEAIQTCGKAEVTATRARLDDRELEPLENMWVTSEEEWSLADAAALAEHGWVEATLARRVYGIGHVLGDATRDQRVWAVRAPSSEAQMTFVPRERLGARSEPLTGIVQLRSQAPTLLLSAPATWRADPAGEPPARAPGTLRVGSLNLNNYFAELGLFGARTALELERQRTKLVKALRGLDADILALTELGAGSTSLQHLAEGLNGDAGFEPYSYSAATPPGSAVQRAAVLYRASSVRPLAEAEFLESRVFRRPPLRQTFEVRGARVALVVVHFKSKRCDAGLAPGREGCGGEAREAEVAALVQSIEASPDLPERLLVIGDFNADALEPPLLDLARAGFWDLLEVVPSHDRYSYVYEGRASLLDHALATPELARSLVRAGVWHINADELAIRDYRADNPASAYRADPLRSSDHDAIWIDLGI